MITFTILLYNGGTYFRINEYIINMTDLRTKVLYLSAVLDLLLLCLRCFLFKRKVDIILTKISYFLQVVRESNKIYSYHTKFRKHSVNHLA